jgi:hypothetical protein
MPAIDWATDFSESGGPQIEELADQLLAVYRDVVVSAKDDSDLTTLEAITVAAWDGVFIEEAKVIARIHASGISPSRKLDTSLFPVKFAMALVKRFHEPLCAELRENKDIVLLAPTIITLLNLPVEIGALAVPISAIVARIGIAGLCQELSSEPEPEKPSHASDLIQIHEANLRYLELERARYLPRKVPAELDRAIAFEEKRIASLRRPVS